MNVFKILRGAAAAVALVSTLLTTPDAHAEIRNYVGVGEYLMGDSETLEDAKQRAKLYAERNAQEQAGVFVQSYTNVRNSVVTDDEIFIFTAGILNITNINYKLIPMAGDSAVLLRATVNANIDTEEINRWLDRQSHQNSQLAAQNQQLQSTIDEKDKIIEDLRSQLQNAQFITQHRSHRQSYQAVEVDYSNQKVQQAAQFYDSGDFINAISLLNEALALNPHNAAAYGMRGAALGNLEQYRQALDDFNAAINLGFDNALIYYCRGLANKGLGNFSAAESDFSRAEMLGHNH